MTWVRVVTLGAPSPCSGHSQESSSLRRQQLLWRQPLLRRQQFPWGLVASVWQSTLKMSNQQQANAHRHPCEWQPLLYKWQQVRDRDGGRGCSGTRGKPWGRDSQAWHQALLCGGASAGPSTAMPQRQRAQRGTQPSLAAVASTCLGARAGLAGMWGTLLPHSHLHPVPPPASHR